VTIVCARGCNCGGDGGDGGPSVGANFARAVRLKTLLVKAVGVMFSVSAGLPIGKEGPMVHIGSCFAANWSHLPKLPKLCKMERLKRFRTDQFKR
jgi:H+/Cl- antiporter ClcA